MDAFQHLDHESKGGGNGGGRQLLGGLPWGPTLLPAWLSRAVQTC